MADLTIKQHDTWPPLRGKAEDEDGLLNLSDADIIKFIMVSGATVVEGEVEVIDPPDDDGFNWKYVWASGDTAVIGTYEAELEITWDNASSPKKIQSVPNDGTLSVEIEEDLG